MMAAERWIEDIAYALGKDPLDIRKANFYGTDTDNVTPYHQTVEDNVIHRVVDELKCRPITRRGAPPFSNSTSQQVHPQEGHCADPGEVRHLLHGHLVQSGRRAGACL
jgi:xanthine dehydrogenase molybdopterin-binding subunit B